jgi:hypothetical protein
LAHRKTEDRSGSLADIVDALPDVRTIYAVRSGNKVRSAEKQTPITPLAIAQFRLRGPSGSGRISLSRDPTVSLQYVGELIAAVYHAGRRQREGQDLDRNSPRGIEAGLRSPTVAYPFGDPRRAAPRLEQLRRPTCSTAMTAA